LGEGVKVVDSFPGKVRDRKVAVKIIRRGFWLDLIDNKTLFFVYGFNFFKMVLVKNEF